jgi:hypothetical protein
LFFGSFALYLYTLAPTVTFWDSGELIAASCGLGIAHQPGYPLFALTGKLFSLIPFGSAAYRLNLLSAAFSALGVFVVYLVLLEITGRQPAPLSLNPSSAQSGEEDVAPSGAAMCALAAFVLAAVRTYWSQAVVTEVYALNSFFIALLILLYVKASRGRLTAWHYMPLSGFVFGLGLVNHESLVLYLPALALTWLILPGLTVSARVKLVAASVFFVLLGLSVYLYLPVRSLAGPGLNIGHPEVWGRFWWTVKWGQYIRAGLPVSYAESLVMKLEPLDPRVLLGIPAGAYLFWRLIRINWRLFSPLILFALIYGLGISTQVLGGKDEAFGLAAKFYIPVFMMSVIFIGALAVDIIVSARSRYTVPAVTLIFGLTALALVYDNRRPDDYGKNFIAYDYATNSLNSAGEGGVLFTWGDNGVFPLWYRQQVERYRDDVVLVHTPLMTYDWYLKDVNTRLGVDVVYMDPYFLGENVYRIFKSVTPGRAVCYDYSTTHFLKMDMTRLKARGLVYFEGPVPPGDPWPGYVFRGVSDPGVYKGAMERNIIQIYEYQRKVTGGK